MFTTSLVTILTDYDSSTCFFITMQCLIMIYICSLHAIRSPSYVVTVLKHSNERDLHLLLLGHHLQSQESLGDKQVLLK